MSSPAEDLRAVWYQADPWDYRPSDLASAQMECLRLRLEERREQIPVLDQLARHRQVRTIDTLADALPVLFPHTVYKSYPAAGVSEGRWPDMTRWLGLLSTSPTSNVRLESVEDMGGWIRALRAAGHFPIASSGTSGHHSFVNQCARDTALQSQCILKTGEVAAGIDGSVALTYFRGGPRFGYSMGAEQSRLTQTIYPNCREEFFIGEEGVTIKDLDRSALIRKAAAEGAAPPDGARNGAFPAAGSAVDVESLMSQWLDSLFARWGQPIYLFGALSILWRIVEEARKRGIADATFNKSSIIRTGGGMKSFKTSVAFYDEAERFFGIPRRKWIHVYGMTELSSQFLECEHRRFHVPPTILPIMLDRDGRRLVEQGPGLVEGRGAFFDIGLEGRWGGLVSGDKLLVDFSPCPCGRASASVVSATRYQDLPEGEIRLPCADRIDALVGSHLH